MKTPSFNFLPPHEPDGRPLSPISASEERFLRYRYVDPDPHDFADEPSSISLLECWQALRRRKTAIFRFVLLGLIVGVLASLLQTPVYRARTSLEVQDFNENFLHLKDADPTALPGSEVTYFQTQIKVLQSKSLIERVIEKLDQQGAPPPSKAILRLPDWRKIFGFSAPPSRLQKEEAVRQATGNLTVSPSDQTRMVEVFYQSPDPQRSADFANTLVNEYIEQSQEMRWKSAQRTGEWLTSHLSEMKAKLEAAEAELQDYARTSGLTTGSGTESIAEARLRELQDEFSKAQAERMANQAKLEQAKTRPADSLPEMLDDPILRDYGLKITELEQQMAELSASLTPAHYRVRRLQAQISELEGACAKERANILKRISNDYEAARRRESLLSQASAAQAQVVAEQSSKTIHYNTLKHEVDSNRQLYETLLEKAKQASLASAMRASNVLVIDPATPPLLPYRPNLLMNLGLGLSGGMLFGMAFVLLRERLDRSIRAPGDAQTYLNLPELGVIPLLATHQISNKRHTPSALLAGPTDTELSSCVELATWRRRPSVVAESFRATLTSILSTNQDGDHPQVVVLTSLRPGDGKTTVASNLSIAVAEIGRKVLLIDGDLRHPRLHKIFAVPNGRGLRDIVGTDSQPDSAPIAHLVHPTKIPGLYLLPSGSANTNISSLFYSPRMLGLLERMRKEFDMVFIDAPPMSYLADARVLGRLADGVILVLRAGQTTREAALLATQRFAIDGTCMIGAVLNSWDPKTGAGFGYEEYLGKQTSRGY